MWPWPADDHPNLSQEDGLHDPQGLDEGADADARPELDRGRGHGTRSRPRTRTGNPRLERGARGAANRAPRESPRFKHEQIESRSPFLVIVFICRI